MQTPCLSQANCFLKDIPAPSAFASELPSKDVTARLNAAVHSSSSIHLPVGMIRIWDMPSGVNGSGVQLSFDKTGSLNVLLSFEFPHSIDPLGVESLTGMLSKMSTAASRRWLCFTFFLVFLFGLSSKIGTCIYAKWLDYMKWTREDIEIYKVNVRYQVPLHTLEFCVLTSSM